MIPGTQWGFTTLISGILQGLGAEFAFLLLGYSVYGLGAAIFAGAMAAPLEAVYEWFVYWTDWGWVTRSPTSSSSPRPAPSSPAPSAG